VTSMTTQAYAAKVCNRPSAVTYIAILVILMGFYGLFLGLYEINEGLVSTHGILEAGIGTSEITVGIFALRGKGWAGKSLIASQIAAITFFIMAFLDMIPLDPILFLGSIFAIPILPLLFRSKVKAYFGKSNFSLKHLMELDLEGAIEHTKVITGGVKYCSSCGYEVFKGCKVLLFMRCKTRGSNAGTNCLALFDNIRETTDRKSCASVAWKMMYI
jgi:hypothetical protein